MTSRQVNSVVICADILQKELDVKLLIGCNAEDEGCLGVSESNRVSEDHLSS